MRFPKAAILLTMLALSACSGSDEPNDTNIRKAVEARMGGSKLICRPEYVKLNEQAAYPVDERTAQDMADLSRLGLIEVQGDDQVFVLKATPKAQPYVRDGQLCLAQFRYGKLGSVADRKVTSSGLNTLVAHITPIIEPAPTVPAHWLDGIQTIKGIRGMTADMVQTNEGWKATSESLY